jgi:serine/threonine protein kinase
VKENMPKSNSGYISLPVNHRILNYTITSVIGTGGFSITYKAYDNAKKCDVVLKEYMPMECAARHPDMSVGPSTESTRAVFYRGLHSFIKEAGTLSSFNHPNIAAITNFFTFPESTGYLVMPFYEGDTLTNVVRSSHGKKQTPDAIYKWLYPLLDALQTIHSRGFLHRDIKPDNIFITKKGSPILIDFGSARNAMVEHTKTLTALLSPGYAPLEQYSSSSAVQGPWTDLYALGAVILYCLTGKLPPGSVERQTQLANGEPDPFEAILESLIEENYPPNLLNVMAACLKLPRKERIQGVEEFRNALERNTIIVTPDNASYHYDDSEHNKTSPFDIPDDLIAKDTGTSSVKTALSSKRDSLNYVISILLFGHLLFAILKLNNYLEPSEDTIFLSQTFKIPIHYVVNYWAAAALIELAAFVLYVKRSKIFSILYDIIYGILIFKCLSTLVVIHIVNDELIEYESVILLPYIIFYLIILIYIHKSKFIKYFYK